MQGRNRKGKGNKKKSRFLMVWGIPRPDCHSYTRT